LYSNQLAGFVVEKSKGFREPKNGKKKGCWNFCDGCRPPSKYSNLKKQGKRNEEKTPNRLGAIGGPHCLGNERGGGQISILDIKNLVVGRLQGGGTH